MYEQIKNHLISELEGIKNKGLWRSEGIITSPQDVRINVNGRQNVLNMCANNYLGLSNHPEVVKAAKESYDLYGYGLSSVRFICGTQNIHKLLEVKISEFLGTEDTILYGSCFDANGGFFETIFSEQDAIISDELNHASIIDGIRLCKASRYRYKNNNMDDLEAKLKEAQNARFKVIVTDGVFSMDGILANLPEICMLAEKFNALVMVDDSHAVGFIGENGRGTPEHFGVSDKVDILTGTLGKALGGASGGYTAGKKEIIALLRQRSRPYLFSNTLAPSIAYTSLKVLEILAESKHLMKTLMENAAYFRKNLKNSGFDIVDGIHPIIPVMIKDAIAAQQMSDELFSENVYVKAFVYPVVPLGKARIRTQVSASHTKKDLDYAVEAFRKAKCRFNASG
jgi:glycine C-acetyltransferase